MTLEERNARLAAVGMEDSGGLVGVVSEGVWQEVYRRMEKGMEKLGWVHQGNVRQVTGEYRSLQMALKGTGWGAAEEAWAWIADRQAQGDVRIDGEMGRMTTGKGKDPVWNWEWQVRAKAGRGGEGLSVDMIEWHSLDCRQDIQSVGIEDSRGGYGDMGGDVRRDRATVDRASSDKESVGGYEEQFQGSRGISEVHGTYRVADAKGGGGGFSGGKGSEVKLVDGSMCYGRDVNVGGSSGRGSGGGRGDGNGGGGSGGGYGRGRGGGGGRDGDGRRGAGDGDGGGGRGEGWDTRRGGTGQRVGQ